MAPSVIRRRSSGSVTVFWLDRNLLKSRIAAAARKLGQENEAVTQVILFGSVASNRALPSSDADLLIVVRDSTERFIDRAQAFRPFFSEIGVGVDLFVYTEPEIRSASIPVAVTALRTGIVLYSAPSCSRARNCDGHPGKPRT